MPTESKFSNPVTAFESVTVGTGTAVGLTSGTYGDANAAEITVETDQIRYRLDGTDPTASEGHLAKADDVIRLRQQHQLANFAAIRASAATADAALKVSYYEP